MSRRLWGACASQAGITATALGPDRADLRVVAEGRKDALGWGIGFYQNGEPLVRKCPLEEQREADLLDVVQEMHTDMLIGHVREPTVGTLRAENTHPFRFRHFLFAHSGTIGRFAAIRDRLIDAMPSYLQRSVAGETDSECFFHLILSFLYDSRRIDDPRVEPGLVADAMAEAVLMIDKLEADAGASEPSPYLVLLSSSYALLALRRSPKGLGYMTYEAPGRGGVRPRAVLVACEDTQRGPNWQPLPDRSILQIRRDLSVEAKQF